MISSFLRHRRSLSVHDAGEVAERLTRAIRKWDKPNVPSSDALPEEAWFFRPWCGHGVPVFTVIINETAYTSALAEEKRKRQRRQPDKRKRKRKPESERASVLDGRKRKRRTLW